jgi:sporulation protein YlmC with PRC-barrel domain
MKKLTFIVSLLLIGAFVLTACAGGADGDTNATPGADSTPGAPTVIVDTPAVDDDLAGTPTADGMLEETPVVEETVETPVVDDTMTTPTAAAEVTPTADGATGSVPVTGDEDCRPNTVQGLLDMDVVDAQGMDIGDIESVIVLRDVTAMPANAENTGAAAAGQPSAAPQIAYLVIDLEDNDNDVAVPFQAFDFNVVNQGIGGTGVGANDAGTTGTGATDLTATPATGVETATGDMANEVFTCAIGLTNVQGEALNQAPVFNDDFDFTVADWDNEFRTYWSGQGLNIPATGEANLGAPVVLDDDFNNIDARDVNGEDIGEVEDFIVDNQNGQIQYAVFAAGGFLGIGERYIPVPVSAMQWFTEDGADVNDLGYAVLNVNAEEWENAPAFDNLDAIDPTMDGWDTDVQSFWNNRGGSPAQ